MPERGAARGLGTPPPAVADQPASFVALRCRIPAPEAEVLVETWRGSAVSLAADGAAAAPAAYLVHTEAFRLLQHLQSSFVDRGRKHHAKSLAQLLLGQPRIPFIVGDYRLPGKLVQSVRTLLEQAAQRRESNSYLIGVTDSLFAAISVKARASAVPAAPAAQPFTAQYLRLLEPGVIPEKLTKRLLGASPEIDLVRQLIVLASDRDDPVLILGDTGTGKGVAAHAIHDLSRRRRGRSFVTVSCGAISPELFEAELFGCTSGTLGTFRKGKRGLWVMAQDGTLFLDDVADLLPRHQAMVLRALEDGRVQAAGAPEPVPVRCRVIAATNRDVFSMVQAGTFREDLYYHFRPCLIRMPRLCDHPQDISVLARAFWKDVAPDRLALPEDVEAELARYRWPGNARELRAVLVGLATVFPFVRLRPEHVRAVFQSERPSPDEEHPSVSDDARMHRVECLHHLRRAEEVLRACKVLLQPFGARQIGADTVIRAETTIAHRLAELGMLETQPKLFHTIATFDVVHGVAGSLATFHSMLPDNVSAARTQWRRQLHPEIAAALAAVVRETERLLKKI